MYKITTIGPALAQARFNKKLNRIALTLLALSFLASFIRYALLFNY